MDPEKDVDESIVGEEGEEGDDEEDSDTDTEEDSKVCVRISVITLFVSEVSSMTYSVRIKVSYSSQIIGI